MNAAAAAEVLTIDVISDVVCPWCYIGRRRLGTALTQFAAEAPRVRPIVSWHPFQLNPDLPREGIDRQLYLERKFGGARSAADIYARVVAAGKSVGIDFAFDRIALQPNTLDAHRLISWAQAQGSAEEVVERLFRAYFIEGRSVGERDVLVEVAAEAGLPAQAAHAHLASNDGAATVAEMDRRVRELGVTGVPFFIFGGKLAVSGAHEPHVLAGAMAQALQQPDEPASS
ncbi:MAG TPA: DsbA family oxidoreductase [Casimicrobiaceae bacterium]|nr:DsbA family oxidoreductase [Casimicrobiaceae bacterium]